MKELSETIPVQYEEGRASFMGMEFAVDPRVLIPRPETELLVRTSARLCREKGWFEPRILDLGTGSGIIPIGLTRLIEGCSVVAADISLDALRVARLNVEKLGGASRIGLVASDMFSAFMETDGGSFDCVVSNPPYVSESDYRSLDAWVKAEPEIALLGGPEGMDLLAIIARQGLDLIKPGGFVAVEVGYDQSAKMQRLLAENGFRGIGSYRDDNGHERVITGWKRG